MKKKHILEIERINKSIPKELLDALMLKKQMFSATKEIATRAIDDPDVSERDKKKFKALLASGYLDKEMEVVNVDVEKQISEYLDGEFTKARKLGRLPPPQRWPKLKNKSKRLYVQSIQNTQTKNDREENTGNG